MPSGAAARSPSRKADGRRRAEAGLVEVLPDQYVLVGGDGDGVVRGGDVVGCAAVDETDVADAFARDGDAHEAEVGGDEQRQRVEVRGVDALLVDGAHTESTNAARRKRCDTAAAVRWRRGRCAGAVRAVAVRSWRMKGERVKRARASAVPCGCGE